MVLADGLRAALLAIALLLFVSRYIATDRIIQDLRHCFSLVARCTGNGQVPTSKDEKAENPAADSAPVCFRISGIPLDWNKSDLSEVLKSEDPDLDFEQATLSDLFPACGASESSQVALLNIDRYTVYLQKVVHEVLCPGTRYDQRYHLRLDRHFNDLTPLNKPKEPVSADVIAVTGLGGHAFGSWRSRVKVKPARNRPMWLYDFLPEKHPDVRVMTYGYDSNLINPNNQRMIDYCRHLAQCIGNARGRCTKRPLILIGHSMGGLLIIQTLLDCSSNSELDDMCNSIRGIFLFGTPHGGLRTVELEEMLKDGPGIIKLNLLRNQLTEGSEYLEKQKADLIKVWNRFRFKTVSFYETEESPTVERVSPQSSLFRRSGKSAQSVKSSSGILYLPNEECLPIASTHTDMVKFSFSDDKNFQTVVDRMTSWLDSEFESRAIVRTLATALLRSERYFLDQASYLDKASEADDAETFPWILYDVDYQNWLSIDSQVRILAYRGDAASQTRAAQSIARLGKARTRPDHCERWLYVMRDTKADPSKAHEIESHPWDNLLNNEQDPGQKDLYTVGTLLKQVLDKTPDVGKLELMEHFVGRLYRSGISIEPSLRRQLWGSMDEDGALILMSRCTNQHLWSAFKSVLMKAEQPGFRTGENQCDANLVLVMDLNNIEMQKWLSLLETLRRVFKLQASGGKYLAAKIVIFNPPGDGDLTLIRPSEVLVQCGEEVQECLSTLAVNNARYSKINRNCEHTFEWLWGSDEYNSWKEWRQCSPNFLCIQGKPGSGKSTILRYFKERLSNSESLKTDVVASFFYTHRDGEYERQHHTMLSAILYQILQSENGFFVDRLQQEFRSSFSHRHTHMSPTSSENRNQAAGWSTKSLKAMIHWICATHPLKRKLILIIDALDESESLERFNLVDFLQQLTNPDDPSQNRVKILVGTRPIEELPTALECHSIVLQERNKNDIKIYTDTILAGRIFDRHKRVKKTIQEHILEHSDGVFLWARLILNELQSYAKSKSYSDADMLRALMSLPVDLQDFYLLMLQNLIAGTDSRQKKIAERILQFCLFGHRPIELAELRDALGIPGDADEPAPVPFEWELERPGEENEGFVTACLGNFVEVKGGSPSDEPDVTIVFPIVQVMHQTVFDFFQKPHEAVRGTPFDVSTDEQRSLSAIYTVCLRYLEVCYQEIHRLEPSLDPWTGADQLRLCQHIEDRPFLKYAFEFVFHQREDVHFRISCKVSAAANRFFDALRRSEEDRDAQNQKSCLFRALTKRAAGAQPKDPHDESMRSEVENDPAALMELGCLAIEKGMSTAVDTILEVSAYMSLTCDDWFIGAGVGTQPLTWAVKQRDLLMARLLRRKWRQPADQHRVRSILPDHAHETPDPVVHRPTSLSPLHEAVKDSNPDMIRILVDTNYVQYYNSLFGCVPWTPYHAAGGVDGDCSIIEMLIKRGLQVDLGTGVMRGNTALHLAVEHGHECIARLLLANGADVYNLYAAPFRSTFSVALARPCKSIARLFVEFSPDIDLHLHLHSTLNGAIIRQDVEAVLFLINNGASVNIICSVTGRTALVAACTMKDAPMVYLLLENGADPNACGPANMAPLHYAAWNLDASTTRLLLEAGADARALESNCFNTPLHSAIRGFFALPLIQKPQALPSFQEIWVLLLNHGADIEARDSGDITPREIATAEGFQFLDGDSYPRMPAHLHAPRNGQMPLLFDGVEKQAADEYTSSQGVLSPPELPAEKRLHSEDESSSGSCPSSESSRSGRSEDPFDGIVSSSDMSDGDWMHAMSGENLGPTQAVPSYLPTGTCTPAGEEQEITSLVPLSPRQLGSEDELGAQILTPSETARSVYDWPYEHSTEAEPSKQYLFPEDDDTIPNDMGPIWDLGDTASDGELELPLSWKTPLSEWSSGGELDFGR